MDYNLNIRPEYIKILEENIGNKLFRISVDMEFFGSDLKSKGNKSKNKQVGLYEAEQLLYSKGIHQQNALVTY